MTEVDAIIFFLNRTESERILSSFALPCLLSVSLKDHEYIVRQIRVVFIKDLREVLFAQ